MKQDVKNRKGMSLQTQLYGLIAGLSLLILGASLYNNVESMRHYLEDQLASHAQDAAHSLGLSITPYMDEEGLVIAETMTNAIFDSGYYQHISFADMDGITKIDRQYDKVTRIVPSWFISLFPLSPPIMQSEVSSGWVQAGVLSVQSHPGASYETLWQQSIKDATDTLLLLVLALVVSYFILKAVLGPLKNIESQAKGVTQKRFELNTKVPFTTELQVVVDALNRMVSNIRQSFEEQTEIADKLSKQVYLDELTGLPNRRALLQQFSSMQNEREHLSDGVYLCLISLPSLAELNNAEGYGAGDDYVKHAAGLITQTYQECGEHQVFRISGSEIAVLAKLAEADAQKLDEHLVSCFAIANREKYTEGFARHVMIDVNPNEAFVACMKRLDNLIAHNCYYQVQYGLVPTQSDSESKSRTEWQDVFEQFHQTIQANNVATIPAKEILTDLQELENIFDLLIQPVIDAKQQMVYAETFARFKLDNKILPTADVFAMASNLGVLHELEQAVICFMLNKLQHVSESKVAINISNNALHDEKFRDWLFTTINALQTKLPPLLFEINETAILASYDSAKSFINQTKALGIEVTIERFGSSLSSFKYIRNLDIDYIKVDGSYIRDLKEADTRFFIQTVTQICHGIGVKIIAPHVEDMAIADSCLELNIDALQGRGLFQVYEFDSICDENSCKDRPVSLESMLTYV